MTFQTDRNEFKKNTYNKNHFVIEIMLGLLGKMSIFESKLYRIAGY